MSTDRVSVESFLRAIDDIWVSSNCGLMCTLHPGGDRAYRAVVRASSVSFCSSMLNLKVWLLAPLKTGY